MAFNLAVFKTRTLTAIVFVVVMLAGLLWNHWSFFILFSIIHFGCWIEYQKLVALIDPGYKNISVVHKYGVMIAGWTLMWYFSYFGIIGIIVDVIESIGWWWPLVFIVFAPVIDLLLKKQVSLKNVAHSSVGLIYISLSLGLIESLWGYPLSIYSNDIRLIDYGSQDVIWWHLPLLIIAAIWINDTMAYIVGSFIGKTPLSKISPKKTWEGTIGGVILAMTTLGIVAWKYDYQIFPVVITAGIASIAGTFGDLFESKLKRLAGVKDSGSFMPGHGGFLDRFDSLLIATPFVWLYVIFFMK